MGKALCVKLSFCCQTWSHMELSGEGLSGEGALGENCHCVIKFGATWRCRAFWEKNFG